MDKPKEYIVHGDLTVKGDKQTNMAGKINEEGFMEDQFGNKIYLTDSKENKARLKGLKPKKKAKKPAAKKKK